MTAAVIPLLPKKERRRYVHMTPAIRAHVVRLRAARRSYREIAETVKIARGSVGKILTQPATPGIVIDLARRCGYDRQSIRERGTDLLVGRLAAMIDDVMELLEATIRAGDAQAFSHAAQGVERLQRVLDRVAGPARVAPTQAPQVEFSELVRELRAKYDPPALPKVS